MTTRSGDDLPAPQATQVTTQHTLDRRRPWTAVLLGGLGLTAALQLTVSVTANPILIPALILAGSIVVPAALLAFLTGHRSRVTLHPAQVATIAAVGGVPGATTPTGVAVIEETAKLLVPLLVLTRTPHPRAADGLLVGVATGAGFGVLETMGYASVTYVQSHYDLAVTDTVLLARSLLSPAAHIAWTALLTTALWSAAQHRWTPWALARLGAATALVLALHTAWDSAHNTAGYLAAATTGLALLVTVTHRVTRHRDPADTAGAEASAAPRAVLGPQTGATPGTAGSASDPAEGPDGRSPALAHAPAPRNGLPVRRLAAVDAEIEAAHGTGRRGGA